ncbi:Cilia- and flagella-associated protein 251 [Rhizophlyctis rosea]|uniref:Cilia- and flagella-associated protein 251 n=1 Tax=Rhizophlyctis rosea TaxID=64517 RepID=A0AAD5SLQ3_9FUNG|nr:Cilia- and flagella-associated protein 251 [Rhizophlyctis rosea]
MWSFSPAAFEAYITLSPPGMEPFLNLLDPSGAGDKGAIYREMEDYFYYAQLRSQGEDATKDRQIEDTVDLEEIPSIMQAMGHYPSALEIEDMINEAKYAKWDDGRGQLQSALTFEELIKLYVNHRPVADYTQSDLEEALSHAPRLAPGNPPAVGKPSPVTAHSSIPKSGLMALLQQYGETFSREEFEESFRSLLLNEAPYYGKVPEQSSVREFIEDILGLVPSVVPTEAE